MLKQVSLWFWTKNQLCGRNDYIVIVISYLIPTLSISFLLNYKVDSPSGLQIWIFLKHNYVQI